MEARDVVNLMAMVFTIPLEFQAMEAWISKAGVLRARVNRVTTEVLVVFLFFPKKHKNPKNNITK